MKIGNKVLGEKPYVIAEFGVNHNGSLERAKEGIRAAALAGCDAIKFQTYTADELVVKGTPKFWEAESKVDEGLDQYESYKALEGFKNEWYPELIKCCEENNIEFLSTPFSFEAADFLNDLGMKAFKVASSDLTHLPYLDHIAKFNKPILLSTGASTMQEVEEAVAVIRKYHNEIVVMHCSLAYPTNPEDQNLNNIKTLEDQFGFVIGLSDHTLSFRNSIAAVAAGATMLEKHFTTDKTLDKSADHWLSLDPKEMRDYVINAHLTFGAMGSYEKKVFPHESQTRIYDKRSIVSRVDIPENTVVTEDMITYKRPGTGILPKDKDTLIGQISKEFIKEDTTLQWTQFTI